MEVRRWPLGKNSERKNPGTNETEQTQAAGFPSSFRFERRLLVRRPLPFRFERRLLVRRPVPFRFSKWNGKKNLSLTCAAFRRTRQREVIVREPIHPGQNNRGNLLVCKVVSMKSHLDHIPRRNRGDIKKSGGQVLKQHPCNAGGCGLLYLCALWLYLCLSIPYSQFTRAKPRLPLFIVALGLLALLAHCPADRRVDRVHGERAPHFKQDLGRRRDAATRVGEEACNVPALALILALCKVSRIVACAWAGKLQNEKGNISNISIIGMRCDHASVGAGSLPPGSNLPQGTRRG